MSTWTYSAEGGTNGAAVATTDTGNGVPFDVVGVSGSGSSITYTTAQAMHGAKSLFVSGGSSGTASLRWNSLSSNTLACRLYLRFNVTTASASILNFKNAANTTVLSLATLANSRPAITDSTGATAAFYSTSLTAGVWYRFEIQLTAGSTTSNGSFAAQMFLGDSTTATWSSGTITAQNLGGADVSYMFLGDTNTATICDYYLDDIAVATGTTTALGPTANQPPVVTLSANQNVAASASVSVTATASDPDGSIASYAWTGTRYSTTAAPASITPTSGAGTATIGYTASSATGVLDVWSCTVTDNLGATAAASTEVRVPGSTVKPLRTAGTGASGWTNTGGAASEGEALSDSSDTTYMLSPVYTTTESERRWRLAPLSSGSSIAFTIRNLVDATGGTVTGRLYEATSLRDSWTISQSTTATNSAHTTSDTSSITDFGNLWIALAVSS